MKLTRIILFAALGLGFARAAAAIPPASSVALISKVVLDVSRKETGKDWQSAKKGETLLSGDRVKTGAKSIAVVKFKDNSLVRVRELTELTVNGTMNGTAFSKSVEMKSGVIGFSIKKQQQTEEFRFSSPTSVASIRGTAGLYTATSLADTLVVIEGLVNMQNTVSSQSLDVPEGYTGIARPDGSLTSRPSTPEEKAAAEAASQVSERDSRLEFELRDNQGNTKKLKIDFKE
jgi:hypothetical protein